MKCYDALNNVFFHFPKFLSKSRPKGENIFASYLCDSIISIAHFFLYQIVQLINPFTGSNTRHFKSHVTCHVTRYRCLFHNVIQQNQSCCYVFESLWKNLMMLSLYLYTLIIGHKSCNMLSILHKLTLQKKLQNFVTNNLSFWTKIVKAQQK